MMDLMQEAILLGFSGAAVMDTKELVFVPEYRTFCEENLCGCYNVNPACPPESGTVEEMKQRGVWHSAISRKINDIRVLVINSHMYALPQKTLLLTDWENPLA